MLGVPKPTYTAVIMVTMRLAYTFAHKDVTVTLMSIYQYSYFFSAKD